MSKTYRASLFAGLYFGGLIFVGGACFMFGGDVPAAVWIILAGFGIAGVPSIFAYVTIDDSGIEQQLFRRRSVSWEDIISWRRIDAGDSDSRNILVIETRRGSFQLHHGCVFGKRLVEVEAELSRRVRPIVASASESSR